ncbi:MAG: GIY-YIG nuclease family protein [Bacteroidales bacterium]|nr:GIY-YIG nuclease family protein [Bacteroidales bacterium]
MYTIIDIETTGGSAVTEKITEIAIVSHNGVKVTGEFTTLINPEKKIPYHITNLTGITNEMVAGAPKFYEVAKKIVEITQDKIFVAHNSNFDYSFIKNEFKNLGYSFAREQLCTVKLSRKLIPGLRSYSLGKLCSELGIELNGRHRAAGDALATAKLFDLLLDLNRSNSSDLLSVPGISGKDIHPNLNRDIIKELPEEPGTYYFYNEQAELIYVGKSKNIKHRVLSHFNNNTTKKAIEMKMNIADISYDCTGSELIALLKESEDIKRNKPVYNRAQRRTLYQNGLYYYYDKAGYLRFQVDKIANREEVPLTTFNSQLQAKQFMNTLIEEYSLCQKLAGVYTSGGACFHYEIRECRGACLGKESPEDYNARAEEVLLTFQYELDSFLIIDKGRFENEYSIVKIEHGIYKGFGYVEAGMINESPELLHDCIKSYSDNKDVQQIIRSYLRRNKVFKILPVD